jgi:response regulator RpfG family c-di-GMP phosphodiesterase
MDIPQLQKNVLVVCDDDSELKIISSLMEKVDFHVLSAPCETTSVDGIVRTGEVIDLAIIDTCPNGAQILQSLHQSYPKVRLVLISSNPDEGSDSEVGPSGHVRGYLSKPVRKAQLLGTILTVLDAPSTFAA